MKEKRNLGVLSLQPLHLQTHKHHFKLAAQNFYWRDSGAFTGEVAAAQLRGIVDYGIVGHSERRNIFNESDRELRNKVQAAFRNNFTPILCVGETAADRVDGDTIHVINHQVAGALANITAEEARGLVISYEPIWAIGTGENAPTSEIIKAAKAIRKQVSFLFGKEVSESVRILYGGSVSLENANDYLRLEGIDGLLIGGTSLDVYAFAEIVKKAHNRTNEIKRGKR